MLASVRCSSFRSQNMCALTCGEVRGCEDRMAEQIPFITSDDTARITRRLYADSEMVRLPLTESQACLHFASRLQDMVGPLRRRYGRSGLASRPPVVRFHESLPEVRGYRQANIPRKTHRIRGTGFRCRHCPGSVRLIQTHLDYRSSDAIGYEFRSQQDQSIAARV